MVLFYWWTQITSLYGGPLEFLFVVESTEDPAYRAVSMLISELKVYLYHFEIISFKNMKSPNNLERKISETMS